VRVVAERERDAEVTQGLGEANSECTEDRRRDDRQDRLEGAAPTRAVNARSVLVFGPRPCSPAETTKYAKGRAAAMSTMTIPVGPKNSPYT